MKSITYKSVNLSWNTPSDTGGYNTVNYIITVTPLDSGNSWNITITDNSTSYTVTRLKSGQRYNFIMRTNNSIGLGDKSNTITALIPGEGMCMHTINVGIIVIITCDNYSSWTHSRCKNMFYC